MKNELKKYVSRAKKSYEQKELERLGLSPEPEQHEKLITFMALILKWNQAAGLVSPGDENNLFIRHFCDSLQPLLLLGFKKNAKALDIGSGGGFPSIPIKIFRPDISFVLAESNRKKCAFLEEVVDVLELENVEVFKGRCKRMEVPDPKFDYVVSRGLSSIIKFSQMAAPYVSNDGKMYTFKTKRFESELEEITRRKDEIGVCVSEIAEYDLGNNRIPGMMLISLEHR